GASLATTFSGVFLPILLVILSFVRNRQSALKRLAFVGFVSLIVIEGAYFFSVSPFVYFKNAALVNTNHVQNYPFYLFGQLKPKGWWYYFVAAFILKATIPTLLAIVFAAYSAI